MGHYQLAQINISKARDELTSVRMRGFVSRLDEINALADRSPGFIWRLQFDDGISASIRIFDDPLIVVNMSVWESVETLQTFVYKSAHAELLSLRNRWFDQMATIHQALWWIPENQLPTVEEGKQKLKLLECGVPSSEAFTFTKVMPKPLH